MKRRPGESIYAYTGRINREYAALARIETAPHQHFWRCAHHPSAIDNFFEHRMTCEFECHAEELKQHHSGVHPMPKSWPARALRGSRV